MDKLKLHSKDLTAGNIEKLAALFPNCLTEAKAGDGSLKRAIDFDLLRQQLSADLVEGPQERYRLDWPGKREALATANAPIAKTLRPCREESVDFDTTKNLYIEGDNLEALKLLQETYLNKVKMIYIDPPYNTGNDFVYNDDFAESSGAYFERSNQSDTEGNRLVANTESNGRFHSDWLSMMTSRLRLSRNLLREDGVIFVSIDDGEVASLRRLGDEIFGEHNFVANVIWQKKYAKQNDSKTLSFSHDHILLWAKNTPFWTPGRIEREPEQLKGFKNPDDDERGVWQSVVYTCNKTRTERPNLYYPIENPFTKEGVLPNENRVWAYDKKRTEKNIEEKRLWWGKDGSLEKPRMKTFLAEVGTGVVPDTLWLRQHVGDTQDAAREIRSIFTNPLFDTPKPIALLARCQQVANCSKSDIILDFFSGSATTAHAVMQLNAEDGGNRRHIMVQLPEACDEKSAAFKAGYATIAEIGKERIRRAGAKIRTDLEARLEGELPGSDKHQEITAKLAHLDTGFRVLKIDTSNMADVYYRPDEVTQDGLALQVENIKPDRSPEDLLFQVLLDWGVDLALPIEQETIAGKTVFFVDGNALAACFDTGLDEDFVKELAKRQPLRAVFRDASFKNDATKINIEQIFKALSPHTELKAI